MFSKAYKGRRVLVTGHTGFKGSWLCSWLLELGAEVAGYSLGTPSQPSHFDVLGLEQRLHHIEGDIRNKVSLKNAFDSFRPEMVFHLAAQSLVRRSYQEPCLTFETNTLGTLNVLECLRDQPSLRATVIITSDKCYQNQEWMWGYREIDRLGGEDPYSASKACAELVSSAYIQSFLKERGPAVATSRAGNVIGGGDWAEDRIIPDCVRAWSKGETVIIRCPEATRPWQHVLEPLSGYLCLGAGLWQGQPLLNGEAFNFGPQPTVNQSVGELISEIAKYWDQASSKIDPAAGKERPESTLLKLNCDKALNHLGWRAVLSFEDTVRFTGLWYNTYYRKGEKAVADLTKRQIEEYVSHAGKSGLPWVK